MVAVVGKAAEEGFGGFGGDGGRAGGGGDDDHDDAYSLTLRLFMSHIYGAPILDVSRSHTTTQHSR